MAVPPFSLGKDVTMAIGPWEMTYDRYRRFRIPIRITTRNGTLLFRNQKGTEPEEKPSRVRYEKSEGCPPLTVGEGRFFSIRRFHREDMVFVLRQEKQDISFFFTSAAKALPLLDPALLPSLESTMAVLTTALLSETVTEVRTACRLVARSWKTDFVPAVMVLSCRMLFGDPLFSHTVPADWQLTDPCLACEAVGAGLAQLLRCRDEGLPLSASWYCDQSELIFTVPGAAFSLGPYRLPAAAEAPTPFCFRQPEIALSFLLAAAAEMTYGA